LRWGGRRAGLTLALIAGLGCALPGTKPATPPGEADSSSLRETTEGPVVGVRGPDGSHAWLGIPYAVPPVGDRRWRAPLAPVRRTGTLQAVQLGSPCPQYTSPLGGVEGPAGLVVGSEDCLTLNVWAPRLAPGDVPTGEERLPVMVWIHGGGNVIGQGGAYVGSRLAAEHGLVVVTFNYRLGPLGWFSHAALRAGDARDDSGNYGTLDAIRALEWVRDNAAAFGGDPSRVTIFGESAGGANVFTLLGSPLARGLYQRAIVQSGSTKVLERSAAENRNDAAAPGEKNSSGEILLRLLVARGRAADRASAVPVADALSAADAAALLRGTSPAELLALYADGQTEFVEVPTLFRDGHVLPEQDLGEYLATPAGLPQVPLVIGTNRDETKLFLLLDPESVQWLLGLFPRVRDPERYELRARYESMLWKAVNADEVAQSIVRAGAPDVFVYRFDWDELPSNRLVDLGQLVGAAHFLEVPFVFGKYEFGSMLSRIFTDANEPARTELSNAMMGYWARFAYTGDPGRGSGGLPRWQRWSESSPEAPRSLLLDTAEGGGIRMTNEVVTRATLAGELATERSLAAVEERCTFANGLVSYGAEFGPDELTTLGCSGLPPVATPGGTSAPANER
jgi:para-nitrobenzyl esterase